MIGRPMCRDVNTSLTHVAGKSAVALEFSLQLSSQVPECRATGRRTS